MSAHLSTAPVGGKLINNTTVVCGVLIVLMLVGRERLIRPWTWWRGGSTR